MKAFRSLRQANAGSADVSSAQRRLCGIPRNNYSRFALSADGTSALPAISSLF